MDALINLSTFGLDRPTPPEQGRLGDTSAVGLLATLIAAELVLLATVWEPSHWQPPALVGVLTAFIVLGELHTVRVGRVYVSSTICATVLAMALLGPVPAAVIAGTGSALDWIVHRKAAWAGLTNVNVASVSALAGGLLIEAAAGDVDNGRFAAAVFLAGVANVAMNLLLLAACRKLRLGASFRRDLGETFLPMTPYHLLGVTLATAAAQIAVAGEFPTLAAVVPALLVSELLLRFVAAERAQSDEVMALTSERANLLEQALRAEVSERTWLAGHVHDETLQTLAVARQEIDEAIDGELDALVAARDHLDAAVAELRRTLAHLHPESMAGRGLGAALEAYAGQVFRRSTATWDVAVDAELGEESQAMLYSLARELLGNAAKHAHATSVRLRITSSDRAVLLSVADDGLGFVPGSTMAAGHFGLLTAHHRAVAAGGRLTVVSTPGRGCRIDVELPTSS